MDINIFKEDVKINLPTFIDSRALICANSGGGKSYAVRKILEESSSKVMSIVLDVEGEFRTLREKYDFLLIGQQGDVELNIKSVKLLPKKLLELELSTIIDISELKRNERIKYVKEFLESLMELPKDLWKPCLVFLDEAHLLAGQQEKQDSCPAVIDLMTRGRKRGYCGVLCTQRISKLHKDAVAETNNLMIGRTGLDIDMKRASEILGFTTKQDMLSLRDLDAGEFFVFGPAISKHILKAKVAEVKTTHPKVGMDLRKEIIKPTEKIIKILSKLKDLPQEAEKELKELSDYKKEVIELRRQLHNKPKEVIKEQKIIEVTDKVALEKAYERGAKETERKYESIVSSIKFNSVSVEKAIRKLISDGAKILESKAFSITADKPAIVIPEFNSLRKEKHINTEVRKPLIRQNISNKDVNIGDDNLNLCERKIYSLLYQYSERSFTKSQIGVFTGYSHMSGGFNNAISHLRQLGLIEGSGDDLKMREMNSGLIGEFDFSKEAIISKLSKCEKEIYEILLQNPEETFAREELAEQTPSNYSPGSGGFNNAISRLNTLGLIHRNQGMIKLNPELLEI